MGAFIVFKICDLVNDLVPGDICFGDVNHGESLLASTAVVIDFVVISDYIVIVDTRRYFR